jgi:hypothetical protein
MTTTNDRSPSWCTAMSLAIDCVPEIMKQMRQIDDRSAAIRKARDAFVEQDDIETAVTVLGDLVAKAGGSPGRTSDELVEKANPDQLRDWRGRFSGPGGAPAHAAASMATTAGRISNIARELEHALGSLHHITSGQADIGRIVSLGQALHGLQAELRELPSDLSHTARTSLHAAREGVARVRALLRQWRGKDIGKQITIATRLTKSEIAQRQRIREKLDEVKQRLATQLTPRRNWAPLQEART